MQLHGDARHKSVLKVDKQIDRQAANQRPADKRMQERLGGKVFAFLKGREPPSFSFK